VRFQEVYYQPYGYAGGSVYADKMVLGNLSPSDPNITTLPVSQTKIGQPDRDVHRGRQRRDDAELSWKTNGVNLVNGGNISGATSSTLTLANVQKSQAGTYNGGCELTPRNAERQRDVDGEDAGGGGETA